MSNKKIKIFFSIFNLISTSMVMAISCSNQIKNTEKENNTGTVSDSNVETNTNEPTTDLNKNQTNSISKTESNHTEPDSGNGSLTIIKDKDIQELNFDNLKVNFDLKGQKLDQLWSSDGNRMENLVADNFVLSGLPDDYEIKIESIDKIYGNSKYSDKVEVHYTWSKKTDENVNGSGITMVYRPINQELDRTRINDHVQIYDDYDRQHVKKPGDEYASFEYKSSEMIDFMNQLSMSNFWIDIEPDNVEVFRNDSKNIFDFTKDDGYKFYLNYLNESITWTNPNEKLTESDVRKDIIDDMNRIFKNNDERFYRSDNIRSGRYLKYIDKPENIGYRINLENGFKPVKYSDFFTDEEIDDLNNQFFERFELQQKIRIYQVRVDKRNKPIYQIVKLQKIYDKFTKQSSEYMTGIDFNLGFGEQQDNPNKFPGIEEIIPKDQMSQAFAKRVKWTENQVDKFFNSQFYKTILISITIFINLTKNSSFKISNQF
ncbi:hypothetical protein [Mycoplasma sp. CSL10166]|uniref:hypothetical protein n=1 Tax=Mycoplasma sp. CSL10166 TaxID=2813825 RepID=UPI00197B1DFA|nr:hypothetical protein [Mycoplasma sp. CSL10166]MBN4084446.1 hypothetical protein [Mycoplasma sp. CSL10166]